MAKLIGLLLVIVVIVVIISGQGAPGGSCEGIVNVIGHSTECVYRAVKGSGLIVDGDEGIMTLIGAVIVIAALGLLGCTRSKATPTLSERYYQVSRNGGSGNVSGKASRNSRNW